jgi:hypothetical protein
MGVIILEVHFDVPLPSAHLILENVRDVTGLPDLEMIEGVFNRFVHPEIPEAGFIFFVDGENYKFFLDEFDPNYLVEVTVAVLVRLGGKHKGRPLRDWISKKWKDVGRLY